MEENKEKDYAISDKTLNKIFDLTGDGESNRGFILTYTTRNGNIVYSQIFENEIVQKALEASMLEYQGNSAIEDL